MRVYASVISTFLSFCNTWKIKVRGYSTGTCSYTTEALSKTRFNKLMANYTGFLVQGRKTNGLNQKYCKLLHVFVCAFVFDEWIPFLEIAFTSCKILHLRLSTIFSSCQTTKLLLCLMEIKWLVLRLLQFTEKERVSGGRPLCVTLMDLISRFTYLTTSSGR